MKVGKKLTEWLERIYAVLIIGGIVQGILTHNLQALIAWANVAVIFGVALNRK